MLLAELMLKTFEQANCAIGRKHGSLQTMIHEIDVTSPDGIRFRLKATIEKEKIANEEALSQAKKEQMTEVKVFVCTVKLGTDIGRV